MLFRGYKSISISFVLMCLLFHLYGVDEKAVFAEQDDVFVDLVITPERDNYRILLAAAITKPLFLERVTFESDVHLQACEFLYLTGLHEGSYADVADFQRAIFYLIKKNIFNQLNLQIRPGKTGNLVHFSLRGFWKFNKLVCKGMLLGKDLYRQYYLMEPGDLFDEEKHRHSLAKINEAFRHEGYFNAHVDDTCTYNHNNKSVTVTLLFTRGERSIVGDISIHVNVPDSISAEECELLKMKVTRFFLKRLKKSYYAKKMIEKETRALQIYLSRKGFDPVTIKLEETVNNESSCVDLQLTIDVHQKKEFIFFGNHFFSQTYLLDRLLQFGHAAWLLPPSLLVEDFVQAYRKKGFWHVAITCKEEGDRVFFLIQEGLRISIDGVVLHNVHAFDSSMLVKRYFSSLKKQNYFDADMLKHALDELMAFYMREGFWDAKIANQTFELLDQGKKCRLVITIDEGVRTYLRAVSIENFHELERRWPFSFNRHNSKAIPFDLTLLNRQKQWLQNYFHRLGRTCIDIKPLLERDGNMVSVNWHVAYDEAVVHRGKVVVVGSNFFPFEYVMRELRGVKEQTWGADRLRESLLRLKDLDIFESIQLYPDPQPNDEKEQPLILKIHEEDPLEIRMRAGLGLQQITKPFNIDGLTYKVGGAFIWKNPCNKGDQFRFDADVDRIHRDLVFQYRRPWLGSWPVMTILQGYSIKQCQPRFLTCQKSLYELSQQGFLIGMTHRSGFSNSGYNIGFEYVRTRITRDFSSIADRVAHAFDFNPRLLNKQIPYFFIEPTMLLDYTDNKLSPTYGSFTLVSCKGMIPLCADAKHSCFLKFLGEQSFFVPLRPFVLAFHVRAGYIFHQVLRNIALNERFYLGGANSLRSYEADFTPPFGTFRDCSGVRQFVPQGGKSMININVEVRFPIAGNIWGVIFEDLGALGAGSWYALKNEGLLSATGFGLRYNTPIGPLRFDIGWKWSNNIPCDRSYSWFLTFGHLF